MKTIIHRILLAVLAVGICSDLPAEKKEYAQVSFMNPRLGDGTRISDDQIKLVVEGGNLLFDKNPIPGAEVVHYVNELLRVKKVTVLALYAREGTKFKDIVRAVDVLRGTSATNIGVSMTEVPFGRDP